MGGVAHQQKINGATAHQNIAGEDRCQMNLN
jgi:hypothetical protein